MNARQVESPPVISGSFWKRNRGMLLLLGLSLLVISLSMLYYLGSTLASANVTRLGLEVWAKADPAWRRIIFGAVALALIALAIALYRLLTRLDSRQRNVVLIVLVVLSIVALALMIGIFQDMTRILMARLALTLIFTGLPASMYALFITTKRQTLWQEFEDYRTKLDPVTHVASADIYRKKFEALYGPIDKAGISSNLLGETTFPVLLTTAIIGLGWIWFWFFSLGLAANAVKVVNVFDYFKGDVSPFTYGFLGAYLFSIQMLFRRYVQSDLRSTAYTHANQRFLTTWVWSFVLVAIPWGNTFGVDGKVAESISILAFIIGVFPEVAWQAIGQFAQRVFSIAVPSFKRGLSLDKIEGLTLWTETRLIEEDIENVQNLVTAGIVDLMLRTNYKPERVVDWIDQGILLLHLGADKSLLQIAYAQRGFVTATDVLTAYAAYRRSLPQLPAGTTKFFISAELDPLVEVFVAAIADDPNMYHLQAWRGEFAELTARLPAALKMQVDAEVALPSVPPARGDGSSIVTEPPALAVVADIADGI